MNKSVHVIENVSPPEKRRKSDVFVGIGIFAVVMALAVLGYNFISEDCMSATHSVLCDIQR